MVDYERLGEMQRQVMCDGDVKPSAKMVWQILAQSPNLWTDTKAMTKIAKDTKMSVDTVRKGAKVLVAKGYLKREKAFKFRFGYYYSIPLDD